MTDWLTHTHTHTHTPTCLAYTSEDSYVLIYKVRLEVRWGPRSADPPKMVKHDVFGVFSQRFPRTRFWVLGRCRVLGVSVCFHMKVLGSISKANAPPPTPTHTTHPTHHTPPHTTLPPHKQTHPHTHTMHAAIRSFLADDLKIAYLYPSILRYWICAVVSKGYRLCLKVCYAYCICELFRLLRVAAHDTVRGRTLSEKSATFWFVCILDSN